MWTTWQSVSILCRQLTANAHSETCSTCLQKQRMPWKGQDIEQSIDCFSDSAHKGDSNINSHGPVIQHIEES